MLDKLSPFLPRVFPKGLEVLADLAFDLRWTWNHAADEMWKTIEPEVWQTTRNPRIILQSCSQDRLEQLAQSPKFREELRKVLSSNQAYLSHPGWFTERYNRLAMKPVVYFSAEFGLSEALPLYAGGLGILAGDYLKAASDLQVPMIGIGLLYQEGYFRQILNSEGWQLEANPYNDPTSLPLTPTLSESGAWLRVSLELPGRVFLLRVWQARVGRVRLLILDSNDPLNSAVDRGITARLYDERSEIRLLQEMALGIGGWKVLEALGIEVELCHFNEGHAAFVVLERARSFMQRSGLPFPVALWATRSGNVFTTHTPVAAGFDSFSPDLIGRFFHDYVETLGISMKQLLALGRLEPDDPTEPFNMSVLAVHGSTNVNGVSQLHGKVCRRLFQPLFPRWPEMEVPVGHITNGVHTPSWDSQPADELWTQAKGETCWLDSLEGLSAAIANLSDVELWSFRARSRQNLVNYVRHRLTHELQQHGANPQVVKEARHILDPNVLTIGFARRFTAYKRPNLFLHNPERLARIINHPQHPVQLIVAGKAHPQDTEGKRMVQQFVSFASQAGVRRRVVFLEDYDMSLAEHLVQGVDLWLNTPRRPWEACGTSGMKVLVNGGLNISELEGWWAEAYSPEVGWAIGDGREDPDPGRDAVEANQLYQMLESLIIPEFYDRDTRAIPVNWVKRVRTSMATLTPRFSTNRMLREYVVKIYLPALERFQKRTASNARISQELHDWQTALEENWAQMHFGELKVTKKGDNWEFEAPVYFGELDPAFVSVQIYADSPGAAPLVQPMKQGEKLPGSLNGFTYYGSVSTQRTAADFTLRVVPAHAAAVVPLESPRVLWQR